MKIKQWIFIASTLAIISSILTIEVREEILVYDCSVAEFHPDVPQEIRDECKKARMKKKAIII